MKIVQFVRGFPPYNAGETAGFEDAEADDLVRRSVCVRTNITPDEPPPPELTMEDIIDDLRRATNRLNDVVGEELGKAL